MRVGRALAYVQSCLLLVNHHPGWEDSCRTRTQCNGTRTRKTLTSISYDLSVIVAMDIAVGSSTSTASLSYDANRKTNPIERLLSSRTLIWFVNRLSSTCMMLLRAER